MLSVQDCALSYLKRNWSIIPVGPDKRPLIQWTEFQKRFATADEVKSWFEKWPQANVGIITGKISGLVVVDVDSKSGGIESAKKLYLPATVTVATGGGGVHYYYSLPEGATVKNSVSIIAPGIDVRCEGGYVVAPPSLHLSGKKYEWICGPDEIEITAAPDWLFSTDQNTRPVVKTDWKKFASKERGEGDRNESATKLCGKILSKFTEDKWESEAWPRLIQWNAVKNKPPLSEQELRSVYESITAREKQKRDDIVGQIVNDEDTPDKQSGIVIREAQKRLTLFKDQLNMPHAAVDVNGHREIWPISARNRNFRLWLFRLGREVLEKPPSKNAIDETISSLEADAVYDGKEISLYNRVAPGDDGSCWVDMSDDGWRAIHVTKNGWEIVEQPPILFRRYSHQMPQVEPDKNGDITLIDEFLNLADMEYKNLIYAYLVGSLISGISIPCLTIHGPQGSAKTTLFKMLRSILDPSCLGVVDFNENKREIVQLLDHNRVSYFDNLWKIKKDISDLLCRVITGSAFSQRELYSDDSDVMRVIMSVIGLNGIVLTSTQADLLERSIVIETRAIDPKNRRTDKYLWGRFEELKPKIFGGVLNLMSVAMRKMPDVKEIDLPRMADFAMWGEAAMMSLDKPQPVGYFKSLYARNMAETNDKGIEADLVSNAILIWTQNQSREMGTSRWEGTATALLDALGNVAVTNKLISDLRDKYWPQQANRLSDRLEMAKSLLRSHGIHITNKRLALERRIIIEWDDDVKKVEPEEDVPAQPVQDTFDLSAHKQQTPDKWQNQGDDDTPPPDECDEADINDPDDPSLGY